MRIDQRIELGEDPRRPAGAGPLGLLVDQLDRPPVEVVGGDDQLPPAVPLRVAGKEIEDRRGILGDLLVGGEQAEVGVEQGGRRVVVAGAEVNVASQSVPLVADHHRELAVGLEIEEPEHNMDPSSLHLPRPADVVRLVKPGLELDQRRDMFPRLRRGDQRSGDR